MTHRRPEQMPPGLDNVLRSALRLAVDSVEPAADGLERIRAKITARQGTRRVRWRLAALAYLAPLWGLLGPPGLWLRRTLGAVATRFRPEPGRTDLLGWLRPAAALATGLFVVASASWAIAALPSVITDTQGNTQTFTQGGSTGGGGAMSSSSGPGNGTTANGNPGPVASSAASASPTCTSKTPKPSKSASSSPSSSPSPSPSASSTSPSASPSPSPSPTGSDTSSASPTSSPSSAVPSLSPGPSGQATQAVRAPRPGHRSSRSVASSCG